MTPTDSASAEVRDAMSMGVARVAADHPSAVLLVDLDAGHVTFANDLAAQLAPGVQLPVDVDAWSRTAGLLDSAGRPLDHTDAPLQRVAAGEPVAGEQVTARRASDVSDAREDLWVVGIPLAGAPAPLDRRALVVFLPLRDQQAVARAQQAGLELQQRAVVSSEVSFSISDPRLDDDPLVWVNPAFELITGYRSADVIGSNCRFLQGPGTDREAVARISKGLADGGTVTETLLNYRADGTAFWNHIVISPMLDADGTVTHHVGVQADITERVDADRERDVALDTAHRATRRMAALAAVSAALSDGLDTGRSTLTDLPAVVAAEFGSWVVAAGLDEQRTVTQVVVAHSDADHPVEVGPVSDALTTWARTRGADLLIREALERVTSQGPLHLTVDEATLRAVLEAADLPHLPVGVGGGASLVVTPLTARGAHIGVLALVRDRPFDPDELADIADLGIRAAVAVDNARLYAREHDAALTLQRSLLPSLPDLDDFEVAALYEPAQNQAEIGGDWYDVLVLPDDHGIGVAIGDVVGHDMAAAAAMGQLRSVLRSYAWSGDGPSAVVGRLDELVRGLDMASLATCVYAVVCQEDTDTCTVTYTLAGHPPPMVWHPDGSVELLDRALTSPIGVEDDRPPAGQAVADLPVGAFLVLYTDGLVERRDETIDRSIAGLRRTLERAPRDHDAQGLVDHLVAELAGDVHDDDVCVLVLRRLR